MNKLIRKAKAGVTLVELLVVILIVTILAVSLLPLLKPYIEKSKYAAEPIPVVANLQTKIELYQYEKGRLPCANIPQGTVNYYSWFLDSKQNPAIYSPMQYTAPLTRMTSGHLQDLTDTDWQDLSGKNMRPSDFQYVVTKNDSSGTYCYAVGVFGGHEGSGLLAGTGYAVCKLVDLAASNKVVAVWERYKPVDTNVLHFTVQTASPGSNSEVFVPDSTDLDGAATWDNLTNAMIQAGWSF